MKPVTKRPLQPLLAIALDWTTIVATIAIASVAQNWWVTGFCLILIGCRQHALFVLVHDGVHYHLASNKWANEFLSDCFCAWPVLFDTHAYRSNHLPHHRHLNTDKDPDWIRKVGRKEWTFPVSARAMLTYIPYFILFRGPSEWSQIVYVFSGFADKSRWSAHPLRLIFKAFFFAAAIALITHFRLWPPVLLYWLLPLFFIFPLIQRIRSISEHFALPLQNELSSSRNVVTSWLESFLLSPHNVNYHLLHHTNPHIPFYDLPKVHAENFERGYENTSYVFPFSGSVLKDLLAGPQMNNQRRT